jgi:Domain of unknown function (DUF4253)
MPTRASGLGGPSDRTLGIVAVVALAIGIAVWMKKGPALPESVSGTAAPPEPIVVARPASVEALEASLGDSPLKRIADKPVVTFRAGPFRDPAEASKLWRDVYGEHAVYGLWPVVVPSDAPLPEPQAVVPALEQAKHVKAEAVFGDREQHGGGMTKAIRASIERVLAGDVDEENKSFAEMCKTTPSACDLKARDRRLDELRRQRDAIDDTPTTGPSWPTFNFASETTRELNAHIGRQVEYHVYAFWTEVENLPVALGFGGFNSCPLGHEIAAIVRHWHRQFGAALVYAGRDTLELYVPRPPSDVTRLRATTWEHYLFSNDSIEQGAGSMGELARMTGSHAWFFWWD